MTKSTLTKPVVEISDVQSIGGTHMCGNATFIDGRKYRFVIQDGIVGKLYIYNEDGKDYARANWASRSRMRAEMIADHARGCLKKALADLKERQDKEEADAARDREAWRKEKALQDTAPELLAVCKALLQLHYDSGTASAEGLEIVHRADAAIKKAEGKS